MRLEFLHCLDGIVDKGKASGLATTVLSAHAEDVDLIFVGFVHFGEFGAEVIFGDIGAVGVQDIAGGEIVSTLCRAGEVEVRLTRRTACARAVGL